MPEAAEVTVAAHQLGHVAAGRTVDALTVTHRRTTRAQPAEQLDVFVGRQLSGVSRHGKWIVVSFDDVDHDLGIHLRMSGQLLARRPGDVPDDRHVHVRLQLSARDAGAFAPQDARNRICAQSVPTVPQPPPEAAGAGADAVDVWFRDPRTFGEVRLLPAGAPVAPDLHDPVVTPARMVEDAARRRVGVKAVLLDQLRTVSGIGSYLADEALHRAGISPVAPAADLRPAAWGRILGASRDIAKASAVAGGVTLPDEGWIDLWARPGRYARELRVHGRLHCGTCGTPTRSAVVGGRSARWCPRCQDARRRR